MRGTFFDTFVCVACAWYLAGAVDAKTRAEQPVRDDPLKVYQKMGVRVPGIAGCLATAASSINVRVQSLKTSKGSVYSRQLVTAADLPCFESSITKHLPAATNIGACAEATAREGLNSFLWEGDACTAFLGWRPRTRANCKDGGSKVVYVVNEQLTPFAGGELLSGVIRYASPRAFLDISYRDFCGFGVNVPKGYKIQLNGTEVKRLDANTTTYSLEYKYLCHAPMNLSLWSVDSDGKVNSNEIQLTIKRDSKLFPLRTGNCIYVATSGGSTFIDASIDCARKKLSLFTEKVDGEAAAFLKALDALGTQFNGTAFHVGLIYDPSTSQWLWEKGLEQPIVDAEVWGPGEPNSRNSIAHASNSGRGSFSIFTTKSDNLGTVCYIPIIV